MIPKGADLPEDGRWPPPPRGPLEEEEAERGGGTYIGKDSQTFICPHTAL